MPVQCLYEVQVNDISKRWKRACGHFKGHGDSNIKEDIKNQSRIKDIKRRKDLKEDISREDEEFYQREVYGKEPERELTPEEIEEQRLRYSKIKGIQ